MKKGKSIAAAAAIAATVGLGSTIQTVRASDSDSCEPSGFSRTSAAVNFARALDARKGALDWETRKQAELEMTRALQAAGLHASAHRAYQALVEDDDAPAAVRHRALACSIEIERKFPSLTARRLPGFLKEHPELSTRRSETQEWIFRQFQAALAGEGGRNQGAAQEWASLLTAGSPHAQLAQAWLLGSQKKPVQAYAILSKLVVRSDLPRSLQTHQNANLILAARMAYALDRHEEAAKWLRQVDKKSNLSPSSLEELTWALLEADAPGQAVGTALQLQKGLMNRAFAPEAPMVLAMALNEACHFPAALKTIQRFKSRWQPTYEWMSRNLPGSHALLPRTRELLKTKARSIAQAPLPPVLGWELIRSPRYVSNETLSRELEKSFGRFMSLREQTQREQVELAREILRSNERITGRIRELRRKNPEGDLPQSLVADLKSMRESWKTYRALRRAAGPIKRMAEHSKGWTREFTARLGLELEADLQRKLKRMHARIEDVLDNLNLIEIEILDGASRDLVWQNAHPEFAEAARREMAKVETGNNWSWGSAWTQLNSDDSEENEEIWEDELGSHAVALNNRCEQKDRYMALRKRS